MRKIPVRSKSAKELRELALLHERVGQLETALSARERAEEEWEQEQQASVHAMVATLVHEMGNPLNGMFATVQLLQQHLEAPHGPHEVFLHSATHDLIREIDRLQALLREFQTFSGVRPLDLQPIELTAVAAAVLKIEAPSYEVRAITVEHDFAPELPAVLADANKIEQVVLNLCKNAVEAMPQGGALTVRTWGSGAWVYLEVSDTGDGIPEGLNIFAPFVTTKPTGSGLGLAVAQHLALRHGGALTYRSAHGQGATFTLKLPAAPSSGATSSRRSKKLRTNGKLL